ncbi:MAG TPA: hypothetical protein VIO61_14570 [Anaerolineaceae bacterium]
MSVVTIVGAGMMGTALCYPLADNQHTIRLVGTPLDEEIITSIRSKQVHPILQRRVPDGIKAYSFTELPQALAGTHFVINGVSSFGIPWFASTVGPLLKPEVPVLSVTKGLEDQPNGDLLIFPTAINNRLPPQLKDKISLNAIGGPCTAHELAARRQTCVVYTGKDLRVLEQFKALLGTPYYHIWLSLDMLGVEFSAALKNAYALAVGIAVGMMEKAGPDGLALAYNPQAALFAQGTYEIRRWLELAGAGVENASWLPGAGDLYVTIYGGRTVRLGKLLGQGVAFVEAMRILSGVTLESVEIITRIGRALSKLEARRIIQPDDFPLIRHLNRVINYGEKVNIPWDSFFHRI